MSRRQMTLFKVSNLHGGELSVGKRKTKRPVVTKRAMHLVMRASRAKRQFSLLTPLHAKFIRALLFTLSKLYKVRIYEFANCGNHLHLLVQAKDRSGFQSFLRVLAGRIALKVTRATKGKALKERFWDLPAFTRIVEWRKAFEIARKYVIQNRLEALGILPKRPALASTNKSPPKTMAR